MGASPLLLDVGCAGGDFARHMRDRHGFRVEGVEPGANTGQITDFPCHRGFLPALALPPAHFDAVTAWAVIEHTHDPAAYFRKVADVLKPGGRFAFLVTNFESVSSRYLYQEDPPRHLYFFSSRTICRYLDGAGLRLLRMSFDDRIYPMYPVNWVPFQLRRLLGRPPFLFEELPETRQAFLKRTHTRPGLRGTLAHALRRPDVVLDRLLMPFVTRAQILMRRYGVLTVLAEKAS